MVCGYELLIDHNKTLTYSLPFYLLHSDLLVENLLVQKQQYNYLRRNTSQGASPQKNDFMLEFLNTFE